MNFGSSCSGCCCLSNLFDWVVIQCYIVVVDCKIIPFQKTFTVDAIERIFFPQSFEWMDEHGMEFVQVFYFKKLITWWWNEIQKFCFATQYLLAIFFHLFSPIQSSPDMMIIMNWP